MTTTQHRQHSSPLSALHCPGGAHNTQGRHDHDPMMTMLTHHCDCHNTALIIPCRPHHSTIISSSP